VGFFIDFASSFRSRHAWNALRPSPLIGTTSLDKTGADNFALFPTSV
jgi:hypothetical protein